MRLNFEQLEDIITVGESKAAKENKRFKIYLSYENPPEPEDIEEGTLSQSLGFFIQFRPSKEEVREGMFDRKADESEISQYWRTQKGDKEWKEGDFGVGYLELRQDRANEFLEREFIIKVNGQTYASWDKFAKDFGLTELATVATKIPKALAIKLQKITEEEGETPSWRIRLLIQEYLTEKITDRVRQVMFKE